MLSKLSFHLKKTYVILFLGLFAGICITHLFKSRPQAEPVGKIIPVKDLKKSADKTEADFQATTKIIQQKADSLQRRLAVTRTQLTAAKQQALTAEDKVKELSASFEAQPSLQTGDSLVEKVGEYIAENTVKDSLFTAQIATQDSLITVKDTVIAWQEKRYVGIRGILDQSFVSQEALQFQNKTLNKDLKRARTKNKLLTLGLIIGSGLAAGYLIQH